MLETGSVIFATHRAVGRELRIERVERGADDRLHLDIKFAAVPNLMHAGEQMPLIEHDGGRHQSVVLGTTAELACDPQLSSDEYGWLGGLVRNEKPTGGARSCAAD